MKPVWLIRLLMHSFFCFTAVRGYCLYITRVNLVKANILVNIGGLLVWLKKLPMCKGPRVLSCVELT